MNGSFLQRNLKQRQAAAAIEDEDLEKRANALAQSAKLFPANKDLDLKSNIVPQNLHTITSIDELSSLDLKAFPNERKLRSGIIVKSVILQIHTSLCDIWGFNNRLDEIDVDVSDIEPSIIAAGTNSMPAVGVLNLDNPKKPRVLITAGSRRYVVCKNNQLLMTVELFPPIDSSDAYYIMQIENMRSDPDHFSFCYGLAKALEPLDDGTVLYKDQETLARDHNLSRERINKLLSVSKLPRAITSVIEDRKKVSRAKAIKLGVSYNGLSEEGKSDLLKICDQMLLEQAKIKIDELLNITADISNKNKPVEEAKAVSTELNNKFKVNADKLESFQQVELTTKAGVSKALIMPDNFTDEQFQMLLQIIQKEIDLS